MEDTQERAEGAAKPVLIHLYRKLNYCCLYIFYSSIIYYNIMPPFIITHSAPNAIMQAIIIITVANT